MPEKFRPPAPRVNAGKLLPSERGKLLIDLAGGKIHCLQLNLRW